MAGRGELNDLTLLLKEIRSLDSADPESRKRLFEAAYEELRSLARSQMKRERPDHTLRPTALVHEAYIRLIRQDNVEWRDRAHFFGIAARAMRQILVEHARGRSAEKRGGGRTLVTLDEGVVVGPGPDLEVIAFHEALDRLTALDGRAARVAELRAFAGLSAAEVSAVLGVSKRTVEVDWSFARMWIAREMGSGAG
jgi:RNA polymerase sigma factor (TIGR02999 family)